MPKQCLQIRHHLLTTHITCPCTPWSRKAAQAPNCVWCLMQAAHTSTGISLNQSLLVGPTLHPTLETILLRFRTYPIAVSADISKMYREVELAEEDRDLHRFLWRPTPDDPVQDYRMKRVTFGVSASPYLAVRTLQQTAMHRIIHQQVGMSTNHFM